MRLLKLIATHSRALIACGAFVATALFVPTYFLNDGPPLLTPLIVIAAAIAALLALIPASARRLDRWSAALDAIALRRRSHVAVAVGALSSVVLTLLTVVLHRPMQLLWHDEFQFHLQSQMLSRFRLWMPTHPLSDFFDTFYVLMTPHYAAQSFPGASLLFVPTVWLHLPTWVMPILVAGAVCGLLWWVLSRLVDATSALVAVAMLLCNWGYLRVSTMYLAQIPALLMGLVAFAAMLRWREAPTRGSAAVMGAALGWAAITRPLDAACYGLIVLIGLATSIWQSGDSAVRFAALRRASLVVLCAAPFLALQSAFNVGMTSSPTTTPFALYNQRDQPALAYGGAADTTRAPQSTVPQKQAFYAFSTMGFVKMYHDPRMRPSILWRIRLNETQAFLAPTLLLLPFAALGLFGLVSRERWMLAAIAPLFIASYHWYPIYNAHYITFALPALLLLFAMAPSVASRLVTASNAAARSATVRRLVLTVLVGISLGALADRAVATPADAMQRDRQVVETALQSVSAPAIVLFTAPVQPESMHTEFVYNDNTAWPDDAPMIRAHDRGADNIVLYRYYAEREPARQVWRYNRSTRELTRLGDVRELARAESADR